MNRRRLLFGSGAAFSTVFAGCSSTQTDDGNGNGEGEPDRTSAKEPLESWKWLGSGSIMEDSISIGSGLAVFDVGYEGDDFSLRVSPLEEGDPYELKIDREYDGASATLFEGGDYVLHADGNGAQWSVEIRHPRAESGSIPETISDNGPVVAGPFEFDSIDVAHLSPRPETEFEVTIYPPEGDSGERLTTGEGGKGEVSVDFDGVGWVDVQTWLPWQIMFD